MMNPENSPPRRRAYDLEPVLPTALDDAMPPQMVTAVPLSDMSTLGEDTFTGRDVNAHIIPLSPRRIFEAVTHHASSPRKQNTTAPHSPPTGHVFLSARSMFNDELGEDEDTTAISTSEGSSRGRIYFLALICGPLLVGGIIALVFGLVALRGHNASQQSQSMESVGPPSLGFPPTTSPNTRPVDTGALMPSPTPTLFDDPPFPWFEGNGPTSEPTSSNLLDFNTTMTLPIAPGPTPPAVAITQPPAPTPHPIQEPARTPTPRPIFSTTKQPSTSYTPEPTLSPSKRPTPRPNPAPPTPPTPTPTPTQRPVSLTTVSTLAQRDTPSSYYISVPTPPPSKRPTSRPSQRPPLTTLNPTKTITKYPTGPYVPNPTKPTPRPTSLPEEAPTPNPRNPLPLPTPMPTLRPAVSTLPPFGLDRPYLEVTLQPAAIVQELPVPSPIPTKSPSTSASDELSGPPSSMPGGQPRSVPSFPPSSAPSLRRTTSPPTVASSQKPTAYPTDVPTHLRSEPPTEHPTEAPSSGIVATPEPSPRPSVKPTPFPSQPGPSMLEPTEVPASTSARPSSKPLS